MIERYDIKEISNIFNLKSRYEYFLKVELAVLEGYVDLGVVPIKDFELIKKNSKVNLKRINEIERETKHDVIAFTRSIDENLNEEKKWVHYNLTSTDVVDTALSLQIKDANKIILEDAFNLLKTLQKLALLYKDTPIIGRSHGIHGEVTSFGLKFALFYDELKRDIDRFNYEKQYVEVVKLSGAMGNFANLPYELEGIVASKLGLGRPNISTQVLSRDRLIGYTFSLTMFASLLNKIATEIRHLSRSEVGEVNEYFDKNQKGSSAMPHKKNPIGSENICGLSRMVISSLNVAFENNALWHERDISHSSNERIYIPDDLVLLSYMLRRMNKILSSLEVHPDKMLKNINLSNGVIYSGRVLNYCVKNKNYSREEIYDKLQKLSYKALETNVNLKDLLLNDEFFKSILDENTINDLFKFDYCFEKVGYIYKKVGLL